jgi:hypothetical protein
MYRLGELSDSQRTRAGAAMLVIGVALMALAVILVHFAGLPKEEFIDGQFVPVVVEPAIFDAIPRGWLPKAVGYVLAFGASQLMIVGAALLWVLNQKMTWARAAFAAFLTWMEFVIIYGIVPSEWLNLAQTDLDWSPTKVFFTVPEWLVLGNDVAISYSALKDIISGGYNMTVLFGAAFLAYKLQDIRKGRPAAKEPPVATSPYGRPLVRKGED